MGVKDLWSVLTPHAERKPICELRGKTVAIDLAGWVCESLNVVDYFVHPRHHLKNLFFRTCYLIWVEVTPVFVLEGKAPKLKSQVIAKRNELQFRGVKPKQKAPQQERSSMQPAKDKGRTRFNHVLKQCESLLQSMGIQCVEGPGEAEGYCAFLNKHGLVDGVISQDSDCFAYGALRVYRNFSVSTQGAQAASGGAVDIYDMRNICKEMDFGQNKVIVMALLCGCDYCPDGIGGVGRDGVMKLFNKYKNSDILTRIRSWRSEDHKYTTLEMRVDDKTICSNCGHIGRTQSHTKNGCGICRTNKGCDESLWKEERLSLKAELTLRKKAVADPLFPCEEIIDEFLNEPPTVPNLNLSWRQPNIIKFIKQIGLLLQWPEIYCFQKFLPILTRWQVQRGHRYQQLNQSRKTVVYVTPKEIIKQRIVKGVPSFEVIWQDTESSFRGLIPEEQLKEFELEHPKGLEELWSTMEPISMFAQAYPQLSEIFLKSKEKAKKPKKAKAKSKLDKNELPLSALDNMQELKIEIEKISQTVKRGKPTKKGAASRKGLQLINKFFQHKENPPTMNVQCSTPQTKILPSDLESDCDESEFNMSEIVNDIVSNPKAVPAITHHAGRRLCYKQIEHRNNNKPHLDDVDLKCSQRSITQHASMEEASKQFSLDDSFDVMVKGGNRRVQHLMQKSFNLTTSSPIETHVKRFKHANQLDVSHTLFEENKPNENISFFFDQVSKADAEDAFEQIMNLSEACSSNNLIVISDSDDYV